MRSAKLLFYAKLAEKALQIYERDGWGEFPTVINPDRREIRPTADRGPILLCVDTSGSMRGPREVVAKALALECMRAAREQERGCYVFAFSGPQEVSTAPCLASAPASGYHKFAPWLPFEVNLQSCNCEHMKRVEPLTTDLDRFSLLLWLLVFLLSRLLEMSLLPTKS